MFSIELIVPVDVIFAQLKRARQREAACHQRQKPGH
jgi:hypothetical protein